MRIVSAADDMQAHPKKTIVRIARAETTRLIVFPSLEPPRPIAISGIVEGSRFRYRKNQILANLSMTGFASFALERKQLLGIFVQYLSFVSFDNCLWFCKS